MPLASRPTFTVRFQTPDLRYLARHGYCSGFSLSSISYPCQVNLLMCITPFSLVVLKKPASKQRSVRKSVSARMPVVYARRGLRVLVPRDS